MPVLPIVNEDDRARRGSLVCSVCGYGIARETPPGPCPMCRADDAWVVSSRHPFGLADGADRRESARDSG